MKEYAVLFPGQGSQNTGMIELYSNEPLFIKTISDSSDILGYNIEEVVKDESKINNTIYTQPIMVATSIGIWRTWLDKKEIYPKFAAGHSLGEYTAMVANNTISLEDCLLLVNHRATMMVNAMDGIEGGMAAILGSNKSDDSLKDIVNTVCKEISGGELTIEPVNYNSKDADGNEYFIEALKGEIDYSNPNIIYLKDVKIDYSDDLLNGGFKIQNPNAKHSQTGARQTENKGPKVIAITGCVRMTRLRPGRHGPCVRAAKHT